MWAGDSCEVGFSGRAEAFEQGFIWNAVQPGMLAAHVWYHLLAAALFGVWARLAAIQDAAHVLCCIKWHANNTHS
jgi:hypothetical protein